jgi:hypothetical protein
MTFFKILKNHEKGPKTVPKSQKMGGKWKKGIKNLTLEFNMVTENGRFISNVDVTLVFSVKNVILTLEIQHPKY